MRTAKPKKLYSGRWGAWVTGGDVEPDMLMCIRTRSGESWFSKVRCVLWQGPWGAICERIDIAEEDDLNLEIPFLVHFRPISELHLGQLRNLVYDWVEDVNGPAPEIEQYDYYKDFKFDRYFYESRAQGTIEELGRKVETWRRAQSNQRAEATLNSQKRDVGKPASPKRAKIYSSQPILPASYLPKSEHSDGYSRLGGRNSAWS